MIVYPDHYYHHYYYLQEHYSLPLLAKHENCHTPGGIHMVTAWMRTVGDLNTFSREILVRDMQTSSFEAPKGREGKIREKKEGERKRKNGPGSKTFGSSCGCRPQLNPQIPIGSQKEESSTF